MNTRSAILIVMAALLGIAGCQESGLLVAPDQAPLLAKEKECPGHPSCKPDDGGDGASEVGTFRFTYSGPYISGVIGPFTAEVKSSTTRLQGNAPSTMVDGTMDPITFSPAFITKFADGVTCFADSPFLGLVDVKLRKRDGHAGSQFFFTAIGTDGSVQDYMLGMRGDFDGGPWPPEVGESNTVTGFLLDIGGNSSHPKCKAQIEEAGAYTVVVERLE